MIESADLDARRIGSAEWRYTAVRRQAQADARRSWLSSASTFQETTKALLMALTGAEAEARGGGLLTDDTRRDQIHRVLSVLGEARKAVRGITG